MKNKDPKKPNDEAKKARLVLNKRVLKHLVVKSSVKTGWPDTSDGGGACGISRTCY